MGIRDDTVFVMSSDNGPEFRDPWRGTAGYWRGTYHTAMEGGLRAPFIIRWPGQIAEGRVSNEIVHVSDMYATLAMIAGAKEHIPQDCPIDGMDVTDFLLGGSKSPREGIVYFIKQDLRAVKWREWKLHFFWEPEVNHSRGKLNRRCCSILLEPFRLCLNRIRDSQAAVNLFQDGCWIRRPASMPKPYSNDLRTRVVLAVRSGETCRSVAKRFGVSVPSVVKWSQRYRVTGSVSPDKMGGYRRPLLDPHRDFIIEQIERTPHLTLYALKDLLAARGIAVSHQTVWEFLRRQGLSFKKNAVRP